MAHGISEVPTLKGNHFLLHMLTTRSSTMRRTAGTYTMRWTAPLFLIAAMLYVSSVVDDGNNNNFLPSLIPQVHALTPSSSTSSVVQFPSGRLLSRHAKGARHRGGLPLSISEKMTVTSMASSIRHQRRTKHKVTTTSLALSNESTSSKPTKSTSSSSNKLTNFIIYCLSGRRELLQRPNYASTAFQYMPTWLLTLRPITQCIFCFLLYIFHTGILTQNSIVFPIQLLPNNKGHFQSIGYDS